MALDNSINVNVAKRFKRVYDALEKQGEVKNKSQFAQKLQTQPPNISGIFEVAKPAPKVEVKPVKKGKNTKAKKALAPRYPTFKMIFQLSKVYGVNAHWMITGKGEMFV